MYIIRRAFGWNNAGFLVYRRATAISIKELDILLFITVQYYLWTLLCLWWTLSQCKCTAFMILCTIIEDCGVRLLNIVASCTVLLVYIVRILNFWWLEGTFLMIIVCLCNCLLFLLCPYVFWATKLFITLCLYVIRVIVDLFNWLIYSVLPRSALLTLRRSEFLPL